MAVEHLVRRTTYGATPRLLEQVHRRGAARWLDDQLAPTRIHDHAMDKLSARWPRLRWNTWQCREHLSFGAWDVMFDLVDEHIARAAWSNRQLLEVMVDFWSNHLNVTCPSSEVWDNRHLFDRQVIRTHALGSFSEMLQATGKAPAMLAYLGNAYSTADAPNENWGRELLELHTVGLDYTEADVKNSARILTGLSIDDDGGQYEYKPWTHYVGHVKVLGFSSANRSDVGGEKVAMAYLAYLARHPATAKHLATKLAIRFVNDNPSASLVDRLAHTYRTHDTAIVPVLKALFGSHEFAESAGAKIRTPYEDFIATLRVVGITAAAKGTAGVRDLQWMSGSVGQPPLAWHAPNGYADVASGWASTSATLGRWNAHLSLAAGWWPTALKHRGVGALVPKPTPKTYGGLVDGLAAAMCVPRLGGMQRAAVSRFVGHEPNDSVAASDEALGWRLPYLVALVLDSSKQAQR